MTPNIRDIIPIARPLTCNILAILMDTTGEVPEAKLLQFFMQYVDQPFQNWWQAEKQASKRPGGFRVMQAGATGWVIGEERNYIWVTQESGNWFEIPWDDILYHCEPEYEYYKGKRDQDSGGSLKQIGERVRELREAKGLSVNDLAVKEGMKRPVDRQR